ncbi:pigment-dispersing factor [Danaus plexippus plexippus]|uniref:Pigment-dispersing factor n=1 Tax=Danaus plexippus plexippus TaxID=278856 RepID=A0A212EWD1_DANPL|nr:pigment-dispersing factor [Danaus plexippus plexippus]
MLLFIMPEISSHRVSSPSYELYLKDKLEQSGLDKEYIDRDYDGNDYEEEFGKARIYLDTLKNTRNRWEKRNGDLINFLLGLPKDMLDAGR